MGWRGTTPVKHFGVPVSVLGALHALAHLILLKLQEGWGRPAPDSHVAFYFFQSVSLSPAAIISQPCKTG